MKFDFLKKVLKESWVVLMPVLLSYLVTSWSVFDSGMFYIMLCFWGVFFLVMMICFRLSYKNFYQKLFGDFNWAKFIAFSLVFGLLWFGFWLFVLRVIIA